MRAIFLVLGVFACGHPQDTTITPAPTVTLTATPSPTASTSATANRGPTTAPPTASPSATPRAYVRCGKLLTGLNTPCVFRRGTECFLRQSSCTGLPCTEAAPAAIDCTLYDAARDVSACEIVDRCLGVSDEGCAVGPHCNPMHTCLDPSSTAPIVDAKSCEEVRKRVKYVR